jgi:hypothetical protein
MALLARDFLARVISNRINLCPAFSALFTLWLSTIASVGVSDLPSNTPHFGMERMVNSCEHAGPSKLEERAMIWVAHIAFGACITGIMLH